MEALYALVEDPNTIIVVENCDHKHKQFMQDHKQKIACVIYWASWSERSKVDLKNIREKLKKYQQKGVEFLFVSVDNIPKRHEAFSLEYNLPESDNVRIGRFSEITEKGFRLGIVPTYQIYYKGKLRYHKDAPPGSLQFDQELDKLIRKLH